MAMERKTVGAVIKQVGEGGTFEAAIATFGEVDSDGDIVMVGAFGGQTASVLPAHNQQSVPLGKTTVEERGSVAVAKGHFNLEIQAAKEWHSALKFDLAHPPSVQEWSWGFNPIKVSFEERDGVQIRLLEQIDLREVSPVLRGASVGTGTISVKSEDAHKTKTSELPWDAPAHERRLTAGAKDSGAYALVQGDRGHFLHHEVGFDGMSAEANTRACLAGITFLKGARSGHTLNDEQRQGVYDHLAGHLKDAGIDPPELGDKPGIKLTDQILLATWDAESVLERIADISADRELGQEAKAAAMELAGRHAELMQKFNVLAEGMLPEDAAMRAAATFLVGGGVID